MYKFSKSCENVSFPASSNAYGAKKLDETLKNVGLYIYV
jgi:hypothetical protein